MLERIAFSQSIIHQMQIIENICDPPPLLILPYERNEL